MFKILLVFVCPVIGVSMNGCTSFGTKPGEDYKKDFLKSVNFDVKDGQFKNRQKNLTKELKSRAFSFSTLKEIFRSKDQPYPSKTLPTEKPDLTKFLEKSEDLKIIWLGHSTVLMNMSGKTFLFDPVLSGNAGPFSFMAKRFQKSALSLNELPKIDFIVISHDHYDHLDMESVKFFSKRDTKFLVPLGVGSHLLGWGIDKRNFTELDWWQSTIIDGFEFVATPSQHYSGRTGLYGNETLWASWIVKNSKNNIFFSGDSGYDIHFKEIGTKYGPFDLAFIENGQYNSLFREIHMLPEDSAKAFLDLNAKIFFPIHWGAFSLSSHSWFDPIEQISKLSHQYKFNLYTPKQGELVVANENYKPQDWWTSLIEEKKKE